ncbi:MAG: DUF1223 domain-containing protein, partial [Pseudomonadota bacterium]
MRRWIISLALAGLAATSAGADDRPVVVELFTSQGCSSCPPADELMHGLAKDANVIALALHVDYWDYIGWKDSFASPAFTERQRNYARVQSERMVYTPQMMVNGVAHVVGNRANDVQQLINTHRNSDRQVQTRATVADGTATISVETTAIQGPFIIHLVSYAPRSEVDIRRGENAGRTISYANVVTDWRSVAEWSGTSNRSYSVSLT